MASPKFPKFHGIALAAGGFIENLRVERLAADPTPLVAGRIWYNTTSKSLKHTSLDADGAVIVHEFANVQFVNEQITGEATLREEADNALDARLSTVETDYAQISYVDSKIASLGSAFEYVGTVEAGVDEAGAFDLSTLAQTEPGDYYKVVTAGYVVLGDTGTPFYVNVKDGLLFNKTGGVDQIDNTNSEVQGVAEFVTVTGSPDTGFVVDLAVEFKARVVTLETGLADETQARSDADTALSGRITDLEASVGGATGDMSTLTTDEKSTLVGAINEVDANADKANAAVKAEAERAQAAEKALKDGVNGQRATYQSDAAALNHSVVHGLSSGFVSVQVWVEGADGVYRNDIVAVEETDVNTITVGLTEAANVKVAVQSLTDLA